MHAASLAGYPGQSAFFLTGGLEPPFFKYSKSKKKRTRCPPFSRDFGPPAENNKKKKNKKEKKTPKIKKRQNNKKQKT
jgi:hypothetical protein